MLCNVRVRPEFVETVRWNSSLKTKDNHMPCQVYRTYLMVLPLKIFCWMAGMPAEIAVCPTITVFIIAHSVSKFFPANHTHDIALGWKLKSLPTNPLQLIIDLIGNWIQNEAHELRCCERSTSGLMYSLGSTLFHAKGNGLTGSFPKAFGHCSNSKQVSICMYEIFPVVS